MIETSQLKTLVVVAQSGNYSAAAADLHVTQSAVSQTIKNLERKVGVTLFKRAGNRMLLTPEGQTLFEFAQNFLLSFDDTLAEIQSNKGQMRGKIRVGTLTGVGKSWLAEEFIAFVKEYPDISLSLHLGGAHDLISDFDKFKYDCLVLPENMLPLTGERVFLAEEYSTLVFPKNSPYEVDANLTLDQIAQYPLILFDYDDSLYLRWCQATFGKNPKQIKRRLVINSHRSILQAVSEGLGIAVVPTHVLRRSYYKDMVGTLGRDFEHLYQKFYLVYHSELKELMRMQTLFDRIIVHHKRVFSVH